jgi:hypothetical protein
MTGFVDLDAAQFGGIWRVNEPGCNAPSEQSFHCHSHSGAGLPRADYVNIRERTQTITLAARDEHIVFEMHVPQHSLHGVGSSKRSPKDSKGLPVQRRSH